MTSSMRPNRPSGAVRYPSSREIRTVSVILRPTINTRRWYLAAASMTCCTRDISEEKVVTITLPGALAITCSSDSPTICSEGV